MPRPSTPASVMSSAVKENKPVWCSPGRPNNTGLRSGGKGRPLVELKPGNRALSLDGPGRRGDKALVPIAKKAPTPVQKDSPIAVKGKTKLTRAPTCQVSPAVRGQSPVTTCRQMTPKAPVDQTPPRSRPAKKPIAALVTPTNKFRKPVATFSGTPKGFVTKTKVSTPNGGTAAKASTPTGSRVREKNQAKEVTPVSKARERPRAGAAAGGHDIPRSGSRDNTQGGISGWAGAAALRGRKASPTHGRPPVKHLFLSPQVSKRATLSKKDFVRKSVENHGIWVGSAAAHRKQRAPPTTAGKKGDAVDSEMPPPAQPTNSPEIPKRGSREASGEGIRGYFGAGPMVAPDGVGFVRDRRKCKPRGTLLAGQEGLSMDSESSGVVESSVQMPPPSVASVEWMMNNDAKVGGLDDFSSESLHEPALSTSISDFPPRGHQTSESFEKETRASEEEDGVYDGGSLEQLRLSSPSDDVYSKFTKRSQAFLRHLDKQTGESLGEQWTSQEDEVLDGSLEKLRLSSPGDDIYSKFTKRSQAFLQHLETRQSQLTRAVSFSYVRQSRLHSGHDSYRPEEHPGGVADSDLEYDDGDITIDWRQGLPSDSMEISADQDSAGKDDELMRSSLSFTSSWVPPPEGSRRLSGNGNAKTWCSPEDSQWYGFSPITPEFHRNSQLSEGGSMAFDSLVASSVRRRIMTDHSPFSSASSPRLNTSCTSLSRSMQVVNPEDFSSGMSAANSSSQDTSSSFQFGRNSYASGSVNCLEQLMAQDNLMCQTSSPIEGSPFSEDQLCQTASPIDQVYSTGAPTGVACSMNSSVACSIDFSVDCSIDCDVNASDDEDDVQYASPIMGDYLSPVKASSPSAISTKMSTDLSGLCPEINMGAREVRKSSMSRTLEELMRHNFAL